MYDIEGWGEEPIISEAQNYVPGYSEPDNYVPGVNTDTEVSGGGGSVTFGGSGSNYVDRVGGGQVFGGGSSGMSIAPFSGSSGGGSSRGMAGGGGASGSSMLYKPTGRINTQTYTNNAPLPTFNAPSYSAPTYVGPQYDYGRINYLSGQQFAPMLSRGKEALYSNIGKIASTDNPYMQLQQRKAAMQGYGDILSEGQAAATRLGTQLYNTEYQGKLDEAKTNYQGQLHSSQANFNSQLAAAEALFNSAMQAWQKQGVTTTTQQDTFGNNTPGKYTPNVGLYSPTYGKSYDSYDAYIASGDYMANTTPLFGEFGTKYW